MAVRRGDVNGLLPRDKAPGTVDPRMRREGKLERMKATVPSRDVLWMIKLGGFVGLSIGLALLAGILLAVSMG